MLEVFKIDEIDRQKWREFFVWCSNNSVELESDYTEFISVNGL